MLLNLHIKNLAIVTSLEVEFRPGMTTLTGETGAGKSILIDALGLVLGDRANNSMIRSECNRAEITALFDITSLPQAIEWLKEHSLENMEECILRRVLVRDGTSRAYINGSPTPVKSLLELGNMLVDIHSQHAHQSLLRRDHQRDLLDEYAAHSDLCSRTASLFNEWHDAEEELNRLQEASRDRAGRLDLLRYQVDELNRLNLGREELQELDAEHHRLSNTGKLMEICDQLLSALYDEEDAALSKLTRANSELAELVILDPALTESQEMLEGAAIQIEEAVSNLRNYGDSLEMDPARMNQLEQRLAEIHDLSRKQRCRPNELLQRLAELQQELEQLENTGIHLSRLETRVEELQQAYLEQAKKLDSSRRHAATELAYQVTEGMHSLGMPDGRITLQIETLPQEKASANGINRIEYQVSTNPGQPFQPLVKIASGGELSRISLAIQVATANCKQVPTLIFDEVDVGIGGAVAEIVGRLLRQLGNSLQVLCVTHLPQVASQGHQHLLVQKSSNGNDTRTTLSQLDDKERIREIARMLGGLEITDQTLAHAEEMITLSAR